jgi:hypothetical protein
MKKTRNREEAEQQEALFKIIRSKTYADVLGLAHASANGGKRDLLTAVRMKASGVLAGIPDIFLPYARSGSHGLYIEMKARAGKMRDAQKEIFPKLEKEGYKVIVCRSAKEAWDHIVDYMME